MVTKGNQIYHGDHFEMPINIQSPWCTPETHMILYVNYTLVKSIKNHKTVLWKADERRLEMLTTWLWKQIKGDFSFFFSSLYFHFSKQRYWFYHKKSHLKSAPRLSHTEKKSNISSIKCIKNNRKREPGRMGKSALMSKLWRGMLWPPALQTSLSVPGFLTLEYLRTPDSAKRSNRKGPKE